MARSCVLRRSMANWRRHHQCLAPGVTTLASSLGHVRHDRHLQFTGPPVSVSLLRFLSTGATGAGERRNLCTGKTLGTAVLDELNNAATGVYSPSTGIFNSPRLPLRLPQDPCMDVTTFILSEKQSIGERPALVDSTTGSTLTYSDLHHAVCAIELGLVSIGVRQRDVVMLVSRNSVHYPVIFLATTSVGAALATLNPLSSPVEVKRQVEASGASFIVAEEEFVDKVSGLGLPVVIIEKGDKVKVGSTEVSFSDLLASDPTCSSAPETKIDQDDPALIVFTSGSTGPSKPVVLSHRNIIAQAVQMAMLEGTEDGSAGVHLCCLPMAHVFGMVVITLQQLYRGGTVVVAPKFEVGDVPGLVEGNKVTHLYALPNTVANLVKMMTTSSTRLSSLRRVVSGGAPLGKELIDEFSKHIPNASFVQIYGLTEAAGAVAVNDSGDQARSVGTLLSGIEAKVLSNGVPVGPNVQGELHVRGPNVMKGYASGSETTTGLDSDGWLSTGDVVSFDEEGRMGVVDRIKEVVYKAYQPSIKHHIPEAAVSARAERVGVGAQPPTESVEKSFP